jgi:acetyltransferase-like isoleucine patch superfamily enzyme
VAKRVFALRIPGTRAHRALAHAFLGARLGAYELERLLFYQPMFEALCESVGPGLRLEVCPDSKLPFLYNVGLSLGPGVRLSARTSFSGARNARERPRIAIGEGSYVGHRCVLRAGTGISIGRHVLVASNTLLSGDPGHPLDALERRTEPAPQASLGEIVIEDDAWLAYNVSVLGGVRIGRGAVVAAGSVVTRDVPAYALVAGNPARVLRSLSPERPREGIPHGAPPEQVPPTLAAYRARFFARYQELFLAGAEEVDASTAERLETLWTRVLDDLSPPPEREVPGAEVNVMVDPGPTSGDR